VALSPERPARILQRFGNLRASYYQNPADAFERDEIDRLTDDVAISQLAGILYEFDLTAGPRLNQNKTLERGVSSRDRAEALMLALLPSCLPGPGEYPSLPDVLDGLLTANKVARKFEFSPLRQRVLVPSRAWPYASRSNATGRNSRPGATILVPPHPFR
jgi:hypothetical protein